MQKIKFLIKFGEKQFMERMSAGKFYFSNAVKFRELEEVLKKKGQGDYLEGASKIHGTNMEIYDYETGALAGKVAKSSIVFNYEPANNIPVYCLFICFDDNCITINDNTYKLSLDEKIVQDIRSHFDKADTAAIIVNPEQFALDVQKVFSNSAKMEAVHYFHIEGLPTEENGLVQDIQYFKYLTQDTPPEKVNGGIKYSFSANYVYRCLFCKDIYFQNEQEYRILLPKTSIDSPQEFQIPLTSPIKLFDIDEILSGKPFKI